MENTKSYVPCQEDFVIIGCDDAAAEQMPPVSLTYWQHSFRRFKSNKVALVSAVVLLLIVVMTIVGPLMSPYDMEVVDLSQRNLWPSATYWFGTDQLGRDLFSRVWEGGRVSIIIGLLGSLIVALVGCIYGGVSTYFGGRVDNLMMRVVEILSSVPHLLVVIMMSIVLDSSSVGTLLFAMCITGWCPVARLVRSQMLQISRSEYVMAAKVMGVKPLTSIMTHFIPNTLSIIIVNITFRIPGFIFGEAFLSYVGLGVQPPATSWGALCSAASLNFLFYPYQLIIPAGLIALTMLCFTLIGDGLRDALDPKLRR